MVYDWKFYHLNNTTQEYSLFEGHKKGTTPPISWLTQPRKLYLHKKFFDLKM